MNTNTTMCSPEDELLPMWLTTLMSLKELASSPLCGLEGALAGYCKGNYCLSFSDVMFSQVIVTLKTSETQMI